MSAYEYVIKISNKIRVRETTFTSHCSKNEEPTSKRKHGRRNLGRPALSYIP